MQEQLFNDIEVVGYTVEDAAALACVSAATIRNWTRAGSFKLLKRGVISKDSFAAFMNKAVENNKLISRANKTLKDTHNHKLLSADMSSIVANYSSDDIGTFYEHSLSDSYRNTEGIYYTPPSIVCDMLKDIRCHNELTFLDPCCGSGNFIIEAISMGVNPSNVYGYDIDPNAIAITKKRIREKFGADAPNIRVANYFDEVENLCKRGIKFDCIYTNPPWGKKITKTERINLTSKFNQGRNVDSSVLFLLASFTVLKDDGRLGFLVQDAFFNIAAYEQARIWLLEKCIVRMVDYGKPFKGLMAKAVAVLVENCIPNSNYRVQCDILGITKYRFYQSFAKMPKHIFNFWADDDDCKVIQHLFDVAHTTLRNNAKWGLGLVTGNNEKYCSSQMLDGYLPVYRGADITKLGFKDVSLYVNDQFKEFQQVAPLDIYQAKEKIIYKFISSTPVFCYDDQQRLVLNSANMLIPNEDFGISMKKLVQLLNSEIISWMFAKIFGTHKILRTDIESLPIHIYFFDHFEEFRESDYLNYLQIYKTKDGTFRIKR